MKISPIAFVLCSVFSCFSVQFVDLQTTFGSSSPVYGASRGVAADSGVVWCVTSSSGLLSIARSEDSGSTWRHVRAFDPEKEYVSDLSAVGTRFCWAVVRNRGTRSSVILRTSDRGESWQVWESNGTSPKALFFIDSLTGVCGGANWVMRTEDGGRTWFHQTVDTLSNGSQDYACAIDITDIAFSTSLVGCAVGLNYHAVGLGDAIYTTDGGKTWHHWETTHAKTLPHLFSVTFADSVVAYAVGQTEFGTSELLKSPDGGQSWDWGTVSLPGTAGTVKGVAFANRKQGWIGGTNTEGTAATLMETSDGGGTWTSVVPTESKLLEGVFCLSLTRGNGQLYAFTYNTAEILRADISAILPISVRGWQKPMKVRPTNALVGQIYRCNPLGRSVGLREGYRLRLSVPRSDHEIVHTISGLR